MYDQISEYAEYYGVPATAKFFYNFESRDPGGGIDILKELIDRIVADTPTEWGEYRQGRREGTVIFQKTYQSYVLLVWHWSPSVVYRLPILLGVGFSNYSN